jgi:beta-ribofuranosylaminobenzene 5'-phosphate synthase
MPERWRCVLALPLGVEGLSGDVEQRFFGQLADSVTAEPSVARLLVTALLPGLLAGDIDEFGVALTEIQRAIGSIFASQQGGVFHPRAAPLVDAMHAMGVGAVGQSSWGPTVYGIVDGPELAADIADRLSAQADARTDVSVVDFDRRAARVARDVSARGPA